MKKRCFLIALIPLLLGGCDVVTVYDNYRKVEGDGWSWEEPIDFVFDVRDTASVNDVMLFVRHTVEYPLSNLYMFVDIQGPTDQHIHDTIQFILAEPDGKWVGKGIGVQREVGYLYRENIRFPEAGTYTIQIEQAMRLKEVPVTDVGLRIEKKNK